MINYERLLDTYSLAEILEINDLTEAEVIELLHDGEWIQLPPIPVDCE